MGFKRNKVKVDLCSYPPFMLLAPRKFGKTTFWYKLVKKAWGEDSKGLLISFGKEDGYHSLEDLQYEVAKEWDSEYDEELDLRGFVQIVDDVVENQMEHGIKGVCFDTFDTMVDVAVAEVLRQHRKEKGTICKSLNDAFGGYGRGRDRLIDLINTQIERLRDAGIAVFVLCHVKMKEKTDLKSGDKYEQITTNLRDDVYAAIADSAQMVMVGMLDREISNGKIVSEKRSVYLRETSEVDAGSRFEGLPEKINLDVEEFMRAFEAGVKNSMTKEVTDDEIQKIREEELKTSKRKADIILQREKDLNKNEEYIEIIRSKFIDADDDIKNKAKEIMAEYNIPNFKSPEVSTEGLEKIVNLLIG